MKYPRLTLLFSYYYLRRAPELMRGMLALRDVVDIFIDSGAFSEYMQGKVLARQGKRLPDPITVSEYTNWLKEHRSILWQYVALDVVKNIPASRRNLHFMADAGLRPVPVFVYPEDYDVLPAYLEINKYLCVPGGTEARRAYMYQRIQRTFAAAGEDARLHGLAFVKYPDMLQLPLYSGDSSSWASGARYGTLQRFRQEGKGISTVHWKAGLKKADWREYLMNECGVPARMLTAASSYKRLNGISGLTTVYAHLRMFEFLQRRGFRLMFVITGDHVIKWFMAGVAGLNGRLKARFDYMTARETYEDLIADRSPAVWDRVAAIIRSKTDLTTTGEGAYHERLSHLQGGS